MGWLPVVYGKTFTGAPAFEVASDTKETTSYRKLLESFCQPGGSFARVVGDVKRFGGQFVHRLHDQIHSCICKLDEILDLQHPPGRNSITLGRNKFCYALDGEDTNPSGLLMETLDLLK